MQIVGLLLFVAVTDDDKYDDDFQSSKWVEHFSHFTDVMCWLLIALPSCCLSCSVGICL